MKPVKLKDLADALDFLDANWRAYYSTKTGELVIILGDHLAAADDLAWAADDGDGGDGGDGGNGANGAIGGEVGAAGGPGSNSALAAAIEPSGSSAPGDGGGLDEYDEDEKEQIRAAIDILTNEGNYIMLPTSNDINEYEIMEDFALSRASAGATQMLADALGGRGSFRRFKDAVASLDIEDAWHKFRFSRLVGLSRDWCIENNVPFEGAGSMNALGGYGDDGDDGDAFDDDDDDFDDDDDDDFDDDFDDDDDDDDDFDDDDDDDDFDDDDDDDFDDDDDDFGDDDDDDDFDDDDDDDDFDEEYYSDDDDDDGSDGDLAF